LDQAANFEAGADCILRSESGSEGLQVFSAVESQKNFKPMWMWQFLVGLF